MLSRVVKGKQEIRPWKKWAGQGMARGTSSRGHEDTDTSRDERLKSIRRNSRGTSWASINLEGAHEGSRPGRFSRGTSRDERSTDGRVEKYDDVIHLVEVLEPRKVDGILMREGSDLVEPKVYHLLKWICTNTTISLFNYPSVRAGMIVGRRLRKVCVDSSDMTCKY